LTILTGGGISTLACSALGILPFNQRFRSSAACSQAAIPQLEDLQKNEGRPTRRKIAQITRLCGPGLAASQAPSCPDPGGRTPCLGVTPTVFVIQTALALVTGSMVVMWIK